MRFAAHTLGLALALAACAAIGGAGGAGADGVGGKGWKDLLDTPAQQSPLAKDGLLNGLAQAGPSRMVAVGQRGHILTSDDAGKTWKQAQVPVSSDLVAVHFPTAQAGWAVGHDGVVLHSKDGGLTWQRQRDGRPNAADTPLLDVWFQDASNGYAVGAFGLALRTTDGGATWSPLDAVIDNPKGFHIYSVRPVGDDLYMAGEQGLLLKLDRASGKFRALETPYKGTLFGVTGNARAVVAYGLRGNVVRSTDGGASWQAVTTNVPAGITASAVNEQGHITLASQSGHLLSSSDDGGTFTPVKNDRPIPAAALLPAPGAMIVAGPRGVHIVPLR